jgi:hypothetical protein
LAGAAPLRPGYDASMLVEVIRLRHGGIKLTAEELKAEKAQRGYLWLEGSVARVTGDPNSPTTVGDVVHPLADCSVYRIKGDELVLHGVERSAIGMRVIEQKQAWWCRVVASPAPNSAPDP